MLLLISVGAFMLLVFSCKNREQENIAAKTMEISGTTLEPLASWNDGEVKRTIISFVQKVTDTISPDFIAVNDRLATFDNDGTLWAEQPMYFQFLFAIDRIKAMAAQHPEWNSKEPYKSILAGDIKKALAGGEKAVTELIMTTHTGMTTDEFEKTVNDWIPTAKHPPFNKPYTECVYQPMLELLTYLRDHGFKTFIVSGGGIEFMRPWTHRVYGIPPEQVVGSSGKLQYELRDGKPVMVKLPAINFVDDKGGKPVGIQMNIGKRPIAAFGNSDGDFQMLEWTTSGAGPRLGLIVHHDEADREWAYDRGSPIGKLERGLDEASKRGWVLVSIKNDWKKVFPEK